METTDFNFADMVPERFVLSAQDFDAFLAVLDQEPAPDPRLAALLRTPTVFD